MNRSRRRVNQFDDTLPDRPTIRQCFGKRMMNRNQAVSTAAWMKKRGGAADTLEPYRCPICRHWHVGNNTRRGKS